VTRAPGIASVEFSRLESKPQGELSKPPFVVIATGGKGVQATLELINDKRRRRITVRIARVAAESGEGHERVHVVMVEDVITFRTELHTEPLGQAELLVYGCVQVPGSRPAERVPASHACRERPKVREAKRRARCVVSRYRHREASIAVRAIGLRIRADVIAGRTRQQYPGRGVPDFDKVVVVHREGNAGACGEDTDKRPASQRFCGKAVSALVPRQIGEITRR